MPLPAGTKLGPYEILAQIGAGGMGEVYRASDARLGRTVAIKVLPDSFSDSAEMKQRFEREARTVAALNHPHICTLHDIGRAEIKTDDAAAPKTVDYLVMEHLEGESLADRLHGGALPLDEALGFGIEIADALEKAHAKGVTHRDLKPGNVMLTPSGAKLLDFGLAKVAQPRAVPGSVPSVALTRPPSASTTPGTVMGTMQYMAPEQLEGNEADARSDLFAFGAVLYEMITGRKAFAGKSQAHLIAAILSTDPEPIATLMPNVPRALDFVLTRCLAKDPEQRLQTATDLVWELRWIAGGGTHGVLKGGWSARGRWLARAAPAALAAVVLLIATLGVLAFTSRDAGSDPSTMFVIDVPDMPVAEAVALAPDGGTVAFAARDAGSTAVFVRPLDVDVPQRLAGTEGAGRVFWSPDGRQVAFFAGGRLKRVAASGGGVENIADTADLLGGTWNGDGEILFGSSEGLKRVRAAGGQPEPVTLSLPDGAGLAQEPYFLPDGRGFLFLAGPGPGEAAAGEAAIYAGSLGSPTVTRIVAAQSNPVYAAPGYLLYHRDGTLYAQPFDAEALALRGEAVRLADGLPRSAAGAAAFAASQNGVLLYRNAAVREPVRPGTAGSAAGGIGREPPLVWLDGQGRGNTGSDNRRWVGVDVAADGRAAVHRHDADGGDVWLFEPEQTTPVRFTFDGAQDNSSPIWSPDGERIAFGSRRNGRFGLYVKRADNTSEEELVVESELPAMPMSWSADGEEIVYWVSDARTRGDIWRVRAASGGAAPEPVAVVTTPFDERNPQVSPDGRWLAYSSNQTGRSEIYVQPYPTGAGRIQVSVDGGVFPRWRLSDGRELYFMSLVSYGALMASGIEVRGGTIRREVPRRLFQTYFISQPHAAGTHHAYAVAAGGERFLVPQFDTLGAAFGLGTGNQARNAAVSALIAAVTADRNAAGAATGSDDPITVVMNWPAAAER